MKKILILMSIILLFTQCKKKESESSPSKGQTIPSDITIAGNYKMTTNSPFYNSAKINLNIKYQSKLMSGEYIYLVEKPEVGSFLSTTDTFYENFKDNPNKRDSINNTASSNVHFLNMYIRDDTLHVYARTLFNPDTFTTLIYLKQ